MTEIGKRIREVRVKRGLTQEELAESAKINLRTIQRIENNETTPRGKTLKLIFDVLDIEVIEHEKPAFLDYKIDKHLIWSSFLTILIIISSFIGWIKFYKGYENGERIYRTLTGWKGYTNFNDYHLHNWFLSICIITIGLIVVSNSLGLIKNKMKYIILQLVCFLIYIIGLFGWSHRQGFELGPGLFIMFIATILLVIAYQKGKRETRANIV